MEKLRPVETVHSFDYFDWLGCCFGSPSELLDPLYVGYTVCWQGLANNQRVVP